MRRRTNYYCGKNPHYAATLISVNESDARDASKGSESS